MKKYFWTCVICFSVVACVSRQPSSVMTEDKKPDRLPYYTTPDFAPHWLSGDEKVPDTAHTISSFSFTDQDGKTITDRTVAGKIYVADFFFTSCRGICPKLTTNLKMVQDSVLNDDHVLLLSHSVMPETDNSAALRRYAVNYNVQSKRWHLLTGNKDALYMLARKSYFADEDLGQQKGTDDFLHTENILLIDQQRHIRGIYKGTSKLEMQAIIDDIKMLEKEK